MTSERKNTLGQEISSLQQQLHQLNTLYPGERNKPTSQRDPEYQAKRTDLLNRSQLLSYQQNSKRILRKILSHS